MAGHDGLANAHGMFKLAALCALHAPPCRPTADPTQNPTGSYARLQSVAVVSRAFSRCSCRVRHCRRGVEVANRVTNLVFRFATVQGQNIQWFLRRNCSVTPQQLGWLYFSLCVVSMAIGAAFWFQGAKLVLPFAWAELVAVGVAFAVYARHYSAVLFGRVLFVFSDRHGLEADSTASYAKLAAGPALAECVIRDTT